MMKHAKERTAVIRMVLTIHRTWIAAFYPNMGYADAMGLENIYYHVHLAQIEHRPTTISKLSRALGRSRATILRRVEKLIELGYVQRNGEHVYFVGPNGEAPPNIDRVHARVKHMVLTTAKELTKIDRDN